MKNFNQVSNDTWKYTLDSNKRAVYDKDVNLPKHPNRKKFLNTDNNINSVALRKFFTLFIKNF